MSSSFTITSPSNTVLLGSTGQGQATFTVSNISGRINRGRARLTPQNPAAAAWITLEGEAERDFEIASTQQYAVTIKVPPKAPPGSYIFRLDMVGMENPDEDYAQGPGVTFQMSSAPSKPFPWWIVIAAGVVLVAAVIIIFLIISGQKVPVPDVSGLSVAAAQDALKAAGLTPGDTREEHSSTVPAGILLGSEPPAGEKVSKGSSVTLVLSSGQAATPTFTPTVTLPSPTATFTPSFTLTFTPTWTRTQTATPTLTPWPADIIAWYKLASDAVDTTGHNAPVVMHGTTFTDGGVFCNGVYSGSGGANYCEIRTPVLSTFDFGKFTIQVSFKASERKRMPVFMGGPSYRWIGYYLYGDGHVALKYNNDQYLDCGQSYNAGTWYRAKITYDGVNASLYLNGVKACTQTTGLVHNNERVISVTDGSNGGIFKGVIKDLLVLKVIVP
jgi:hypothetical protein